MAAINTDVLVVGGGPVGLVLAIDLAQRGVDVTLVEKNPAPTGHPKMERCNARTMEIFRRLGIAERVRAAGYPADASMDVFLVTRLTEPPVLRLAYPTVAESRARIARCRDGSMPLEPYQVTSQYALEPLLREIAEGHRVVDELLVVATMVSQIGCETVGNMLDAATGHRIDHLSDAGNREGPSSFRNSLCFAVDSRTCFSIPVSSPCAALRSISTPSSAAP